MAGIAYYDKAEVFVGGKQIGTAIDIRVEAAKPLPKPARVEKWQRWRDSKGVEFTVIESCGKSPGGLLEKWSLKKQGHEGEWFGVNMLEGWTFLGYAKPDKVEVGQRWLNQGKDYVVEAVSADVANMGGISRASIQAMLTADTFEYLGMADSAPIEKALTTTPNKNPSEFTFAPTTEHGMVKQAIVEQCEKAVKANVANVARRANEEAAKRLIANPPEWAYPKAWMCAVLAAVEVCRCRWGKREYESELGLVLFGDDIERECENAHHGREIGHGGRMTAIGGEAYRAYARGMERPSPLLTRQGVKGGISTVDMGEYYE